MSKRHLFSKGVFGLFLLSSCTGQVDKPGSIPGSGAGPDASGGSGGSLPTATTGTGSGSGSGSGSNGQGGAVGTGGGTTQPGPLVIGTAVLHRLTRTEYANTIRDLFGATVDVSMLPGDGADHGFSKDSVSQATGPSTPDAYEGAANRIVESVFTSATLKANLVKCDLATGTACIRSTLQAFLPKAWRRPVQAAEVDRLMTLAATEAMAGSSTEEQLKLTLRAALNSSKFLYLIEKDSNPADTSPKPINDYEFASRLSYFIWSSMPDAPLFDLASQGKLRDDATITEQVSRMLKDPKSAAMTDGFASEWLQLDKVMGAAPNPTTFSMVTDALKQSMIQQTTTFFRNVLATGAPISDLVASDYTFVDAGLAKLYGLPVPSAAGMSKVSVAGTTRVGGLLGQSSLLMQYATADKPSAVKRGNWVLNSLLCAPTPAPPKDVQDQNAKDAVNPLFQDMVAMQTARERLATHATRPDCKVCHQFIDPWGLALENYDAVGQWRTVDKTTVGDKPIDASGQLVSGDDTTKFTDVRSMVPLLGKDNRVAKCVAQNLLNFALTRQPNPSEVIDTAGRMSGNSDTLPKAILQVATSTSLKVRVGSGP